MSENSKSSVSSSLMLGYLHGVCACAASLIIGFFLEVFLSRHYDHARVSAFRPGIALTGFI
jgi:hypothetical protein